MYKILIPLDQSDASERVLDRIQREIESGGEVILLHVIPPGKSVIVEEQNLVDMAQQEESARSTATAYLRDVARQKNLDPRRCRCEVVVSPSVRDGIVDFAEREGVDLITMYTHARKGLAKLIKGSIAQDVQQKVSTDVMIFSLHELTAGAL